jgi:hypothetical protein
MFRLLKALSLTLALVALSIFAISCSSNAPANIRFVHAIQDGAAMDIQVNGQTKFTGVSFLGVQPNQPGYTSVPSGSDTIEGFLAGTSTIGFNPTTIGFSAGANYTVIATGLIAGTQTADIISLSDNNSAPPAGDVEFRIVHASPSGPPLVDVYILLSPATAPTGTPAISGLAYTQASKYISLVYNPNDDTTFPGYQIFVTAPGSLTPIYISQSTNPADNSIHTLVMTDMQSGTTMSGSFLELADLN